MFCKNCGNEVPEGTNVCPNCGQSVNGEQPQQTQQSQQSEQPRTKSQQGAPKSKVAAGLLGILLGGLGIHNFYLGYTNKALIQLLVSLLGGLITCGVAAGAMEIWGIIEGILYLIGSEGYTTDANGVPLAK